MTNQNIFRYCMMVVMLDVMGSRGGRVLFLHVMNSTSDDDDVSSSDDKSDKNFE